MSWKDGRVIDDALVLGELDDLHWDELGAEGHHIQLGTQGLVLLQDLRDGLTFESPPWVLEHTHAISLSCLGCNTQRGTLSNKKYLKIDERIFKYSACSLAQGDS
jgi:hypothetical protein